jgi:hypothetical protein
VAERLEHADPEKLIRAYVSCAELEDLQCRGSSARRRDARAVITALQATAALRHPASAAADTLWALDSPDLFASSSTCGNGRSSRPPTLRELAAAVLD